MYELATSATELAATKVIREVLEHHRRLRTGGCTGRVCPRCLRHHRDAIAAAMARGRTIEFLLPAFPTKSPNPAKVLGPLPDLAEELALRFLESLCERIADAYPPGARIRICSDGRVFNDLIGVSDDNVTRYVHELNRMIDRVGATHLDQFTLDDVCPGDDHAQLRTRLTAGRGPHPDELRAEVRRGGDLVHMYRGITRFMLEDLSVPGYTGSRAALQRRSRELAYGVIARSRAWDALLAELFPDAVRLSIHPQPCSTRKIGLLLADTPDTWLTPWHSAAVDTGDGRFTLMKRAEAEAAGARLVTAHGRPSHFVLPRPGTTGHIPVSATGAPHHAR